MTDKTDLDDREWHDCYLPFKAAHDFLFDVLAQLARSSIAVRFKEDRAIVEKHTIDAEKKLAAPPFVVLHKAVDRRARRRDFFAIKRYLTKSAINAVFDAMKLEERKHQLKQEDAVPSCETPEMESVGFYIKQIITSDQMNDDARAMAFAMLLDPNLSFNAAAKKLHLTDHGRKVATKQVKTHQAEMEKHR